MTDSVRDHLGIDDLIKDKREAIIQLAAQYGASNVRVFGSVARGDANESSDIDLLIDQDWSRLSGWGGMALVVALEELLGRKVDVATVEELKPHIQKQALKEAVRL
ncbi:MAG: nucleotidyltransferase domain-containing protein [Anaerolineae bacterium]|nr:nucleotidyltransferase domain-containing protein [Anaerolineae bacterium]